MFARTRTLRLQIREEMYLELVDAAAECYQRDERRDCTPERFAVESIEAALASRRLERMETDRLATA